MIENSVKFRIYKFISETMDNFFRYAYIVCFLIFLCNRLSALYSLLWLYALSIALFILSFFVYLFFVVRAKMYDHEWSFKVTLRHYATFECICPRKRFRLLKKDDIRKSTQTKKNNKQAWKIKCFWYVLIIYFTSL